MPSSDGITYRLQKSFGANESQLPDEFSRRSNGAMEENAVETTKTHIDGSSEAKGALVVEKSAKLL